MAKERLSITIDKILFQNIKQESQMRKVSTSRLIEEILSDWKKSQKKQQMVEGYQIMAKENLTIAKDFARLGKEVWPND